METHTLTQGTPAWHQHRATHFNASDAPAMLGCSPYKTRAELLRELKTGMAPEIDAGTQRLFDDGHRTEALARPLAEAIIGEELYPVVGSLGELSASFDGLTMTEDTNWECKRLNNELRAALPATGPQGNDAAALPKLYRVQMEQQCLVADAARVLFTAAEFDRDGNLVDARHCWYMPDAALRAEIVAGWKQFAEDLANYVPPAASTVEKLVAEPVEALPAPVVQVTGTLALVDNFKVFEERLRDFLATKLIREPKTDEDFVNLDAQIKAMKDARVSVKGAKAAMLAQVEPVDRANKTADMLDAMLQQNVSMAERLLTAEKDRRKLEIVNGATIALRAHIDKLNTRFERAYLAYAEVPADFAGAVRGLKSLASMENKVGTELARCKIESSEIADRIHANREDLKPGLGAIPGDDWISLFPDFAQVCTKSTDDFRNLRIARVEAERKRREAEREAIRAEEQAKAEKAAREQVAREADAQRLAAQAAAAPASATAAEAPAPAPQPAPRAANVVPMGTRAPVESTATIRLDQIGERLGFGLTADFLGTLGFQPVATEKAAKLYREADFDSILMALIAHIERARQPLAA